MSAGEADEANPLVDAASAGRAVIDEIMRGSVHRSKAGWKAVGPLGSVHRTADSESYRRH